jgi:hypothetical protein
MEILMANFPPTNQVEKFPRARGSIGAGEKVATMQELPEDSSLQVGANTQKYIPRCADLPLDNEIFRNPINRWRCRFR